MTKKLQNTERFPFEDIELIPTPRVNPFRHGWMKFVERRPPIVYRGEYQLLANLLERRGCRFDAHLFRPYRRAFAALYPVLGQALHRLLPRRGRDVESGEPGLRDEIAAGFSIPSRSFWHVPARSSGGSSSWAARRIRFGSIARACRCSSSHGAPRGAARRALEFSAGLPSDSEKRPDDLSARLCHFPCGESAGAIVHRRERTAATDAGSARRRSWG